MSKRKRMVSIEGLTRKQQRACEQFIRKLMAYFDTPEGREFIERDLASSLLHNKPEPIALTKQEQCALRFIRKELKYGRQPSVRGITKAIGLRSSRSGHRVLRALIEKGALIKQAKRYELT